MYLLTWQPDNASEQQGGRYGEGGDEEEEAADGDGEEYDSSEFDDDEIENLLDEKLPEELRESKQPKYEQRFKTVLEGQCSSSNQVSKMTSILM